ncbi:SAC3 family protein 1 [Ceratocystis fimbriata CBS 114723]|uniref:SAC3 family protein 1 n=1 Tax=Ceratocystis fimbriata CBS 114723 TaxID=1035309 RepID=A0A2C5X267_9PEZI|nr:SAC3 family protein 1 [Ceratocystis fimbriata CBS 114723]
MATFAGNGFGGTSQQPNFASQSPFSQPPIFGASSSAFGGGPAGNPFKAGSQPASASSNPFSSASTGAPSTSTVKNPFQTQLPPASPSSNPFLSTGAAAANTDNSASATSTSAPAFGRASPFGAPSAPVSTVKAPAAFSKPSSAFSGSPTPGFDTPNTTTTTTNAATVFGAKPTWGQTKDAPFLQSTSAQTSTSFPPAPKPTFGFAATSHNEPPAPKLMAPLAHVQLGQIAEPMDVNNQYANRIYRQLMADKIYPPTWPQNPGDPANKGAMANFREQYKTYRDRARASLVKNGLIDDPDTRRKLSEAIEFKGVCEDMCPEYEKVLRITEHDVKMAEKNPHSSFAQTDIMVKKLARSAAGQEAPLPMDVRSVPCIRRTLDYLLDDLMKTEQNLPSTHGFLWDRTRAIRRDFAFFSSMTKDEMLDQIYCLETLTRFHVTALHILSRPGVAPEDFSEQQEVEQLGKALLSLIYAYDDCRNQGISCKNEPEFRAYYLVLRAFDTNILDVLESEWNIPTLIDSPIIQTALSILQSLKTPRDVRGPIRPGVGSITAPFCGFFDIIAGPTVSFTMACFAEIHFGRYRRAVLRGLNKAFARPRGHAKDVKADGINRHLRFDTVDECIEFVELHGLTFTPEAADAAVAGERVLVAQYGQDLDHPRLKNAFSRTMVDKKRGSYPLPYVIRNAVYDTSMPSTADCSKSDIGSLAPQTSAFPFKTPALSSSTTNNSSIFKPAIPPHTTTPPPFGITPTSSSSTFGTQTKSMKSTLPFGSKSSPTNSLAGKVGTSDSLDNSSSSLKQTTNQSPFSTNPSATTAASIPSLIPNQTIGLPPSFNFAAQSTLTSKVVPDVPSIAKPISGPENVAPATASVLSAPMFPPASALPTASTSSGFVSQASAVPSSTAAATTAVLSKSSATPEFSFSSIASNTAQSSSTPSLSFTSTVKSDGSSTAAPLTAPAPISTLNQSTSVLNSVAPSFSNAPFKPTAQSPVLQPPLESSPFATGKPSVVEPPTPIVSELDPSSKLALFSGSSIIPPTRPPINKAAVLDGFTRWYTLGDDGLLQQFYLYMTEEIVRQTFEEFVAEEERRREEAEAAEDLAKAIKLRTYNISIRYLNRWRVIARERRLEALRRSGRDQLRAYHEAQRKERRKAEAALKRKTEMEAVESDKVRMFHQVAEKSKQNLMRINCSLGMSDYDYNQDSIPREDDVGSVWSVPDAPSAREEPRPKKTKHKAKGPTSMSTHPAPAAQRSESVASTFSAGGKTQSIMEQYALSRSASLRRSMPGSSFSSSQFARSQFSTPPAESPDKRISKVSDRWRLKAMGLTTMPDGSILPDHLAQQVLYQKKRYSELGPCGLGPASRQRRVSAAAADLDFDMRISRAKALLPTTPRSRSGPGISATASPGTATRVSSTRAIDALMADAHHRKRSADEALGLTEVDIDSSDNSMFDQQRKLEHKEPMSATKRILLEAQKMREELRNMREEIKEGADWLHDEASRLQSPTPGRYV